MKKIAFLMSALALVVFASCDNKENGDTDFDNLIEDGWYIVGPATGFDNVSTKCLMAPGTNEQDSNNPREGLYEKYIILEAGKTFEVVNYVLEEEVARYGADMAEWDVTKFSDWPSKAPVYLGALNTTPITVDETGLYYVALDLNLDEKLTAPQLLMTKVNFGVMGSMTGWASDVDMTASEISNNSITFKATGVQFKDGDEYKYRVNYGWKIFLDAVEDPNAENAGDKYKIAVNINLGAGMVPGASNISGVAAGIYDINLVFTQNAGSISNSFKETMVKTGDAVATDYSNCEMELVGAGVASQEGAVSDPSSWGWGNVLPAGKPVKEGTTYTWTWNNVSLLADGFKIRTVNFAESGGVAAFDLGSGNVNKDASVAIEEIGDIKVTAAGTYNITLTIAIDGVSETKTIVITSAN